MAGRESRGAALGAARGSVSHWPPRELPRRLQVLVGAVVAVYCGAICAAVAVTPVHAGQLRLFAVLPACSAAAVGLSRRTGEHGGVVRDVHAIWDLPAAVLLPPLFALLAPVPRMALTQVRVSRTMLHRRAYRGGRRPRLRRRLPRFHAAVPVLGPGAGTGTGGRAMLWTVLAAGCGLLRLVVNDALVLTAVKGSAPQTRLLAEIAGAEALYGNVAELSLGTLSAFAAVHATLAIVCALPLVISLQRSLRHAQLVAETHIDAKTGLLNDKTWRRQVTGKSPAPSGPGRRSQSASSTSTTSRRSTTPTGTRPGTPSWRPSPPP
jgi:hypothetical protein